MSATGKREIRDFNLDWKFSRGDLAAGYAADLDDTQWREVRLPHDWSVEESFTQENTAGCTAFLPGGVGWYRKWFTMPDGAANRVTWIEFDGVYCNSEVWINGHSLGKHPYGYTPFSYDLTPYLRYGGAQNVIAVRVDRSVYDDCRWYPGSGIYRNVKLVTTGRVHIPRYGVFVTTPVATAQRAEVSVVTELVNDESASRAVVLSTVLYDKERRSVGQQETEIAIEPGARRQIEQVFVLADPLLWSIESPSMYAASSTVSDVDGVTDSLVTPFGIRDIRFDPDHGFSLNGVSTPFKGVCLHHDAGCVGAAVPIGVWERRLRLLQEAGCNAIRTAHNPPASEFLDLCDRMGFLVQDEAFDEWTNPKREGGYSRHFPEWGETDVKTMVLRDRNHPSVVMWSIGNEIEWNYPRYREASGYWSDEVEADWRFDLPPFDVPTMRARFEAADPGPYQLAPIAQDLSRWIKEVDTTRPVTANLVLPCVGHWSGFTDALDIVGYSYRQAIYDYGHTLYPDKMIFGCENYGQWHEWKPCLEREWLPGIFLWTGIDYLGEARVWPNKASPSGLLDLAGFKHPRYHMFRSLWVDEPYVYAATSKQSRDSPYEALDDGRIVYVNRDERWQPTWHWHAVNEHWNYQPGDAVFVEVYTNCPEVELFVNGASAGTQRLADFDDHIIKWLVPYEAGRILVAGKTEGEPATYELVTAQAPANIRLTADKTTVRADCSDVVHLVAQLCDENGVPVKVEEREIHFDIQGLGHVLGVDNGAIDSVQDFKADRCVTAQGRCLLILQANDTAGSVTVTAFADGVQSQSVTLTIR